MTRHILLDLDHTLYPPSTGLMDEMNSRIERFVAEFLRVTPLDAEHIRRDFRNRHGSTLRGLLVEHGADPDRFLDFVHEGLPGTLLNPDPVLNLTLSRLVFPTHIFTNAPEAYARRAVQALGVEKHLQQFFDIAITDYVGKPDLSAYKVVENALQTTASSCLLVDDALPNVQGALAAGWRALWLTDGPPVPGVQILRSVSELPEFLESNVVPITGGH